MGYLLGTGWMDLQITPIQAPQVCLLFVCLLVLTAEETESQRGEVICLKSHNLGSQVSQTANLSLCLDMGLQPGLSMLFLFQEQESAKNLLDSSNIFLRRC